MADSLRAVLPLLQHMRQSSLPAPAVSTFTTAAECILTQLQDGTPAHQVLVQLQQEVWQHMQTKAGAEADVVAAYLPALNVFEGTDAVQTVLLMAQNGLSGLNGDCCLALVCVMEEHHHAWLCETFGALFLDRLEALADKSSQSPAGSADWLRFPDHALTRLSEVHLDAENSFFELMEGETPLWMVPMTAWQHSQISIKHFSAQQGGKEPPTQVAEPSAAEKLAEDFGHLEIRSKSKRRK